MVRAKSLLRFRGEEPGLDLSSLIDVSFLLLIYFICTSTLQPRESDMNLLIAGTPGPGYVTADPMMVHLRADGTIVANDEVLDTNAAVRSLPLLRDRLETYQTISKLTASPPKVTYSADDGAKGQRFVDVLNVLAQVGITDISLGASEH